MTKFGFIFALTMLLAATSQAFDQKLPLERCFVVQDGKFGRLKMDKRNKSIMVQLDWDLNERGKFSEVNGPLTETWDPVSRRNFMTVFLSGSGESRDYRIEIFEHSLFLQELSLAGKPVGHGTLFPYRDCPK